ncbi:FAD-binding oxidoreductase [Roseobacter denitrificans]|uniref:Oxidoreductase, putative n=1 Tax=Roseobacter denitrificans (strain ATCC 33942 / OCh 114) TaxID=375451 RepID=Q16DP5_ROSDO|nr:FAD-binding oxidoreductase [Roseobacter denitrificans]ABG29898.1 oxidoreductase, putative [Roseobacter denitrificans OCh 114]AVL53112.1 FAD-binding oxidoreductase [Roseobacter denitrificans]SFG37847.1 Glycine/D-amino acid oxidase [Roseobacter denitrificans OCh 114]
MQRILSAYAYGAGPRAGCWWDETCDLPKLNALQGDLSVDVAIIGGGFTGLSAALHLATQGVKVTLLEAQDIGWGASGRNGGFCCLGGGIAGDDALDSRYGRDARLGFRNAEKAAVLFVEETINRLGLDVDRHSKGETEFACRPKDMAGLAKMAKRTHENYGVEATVIDQSDLAGLGMTGGPAFFGALSIPIGFGLNPRKLLAGFALAAIDAGADLFAASPVLGVARNGHGHALKCPQGVVNAQQVIVATNGYSSEDIPIWLASRFMPVQSTVLVTRPLSNAELDAQGWTTEQMGYDSQNLLHYFRLMPDRRFLFGMRGAIRSGPRAEMKARQRTQADFRKMFPAWSTVEISNMWSGMVSLARKKLPFVGEIPASNGIWTAMCYHGNGVAMGSYAGKLVADMVLGRATGECPEVMTKPLTKFPLGRVRRMLLPPVYGQLMLQDRF